MAQKPKLLQLEEGEKSDDSLHIPGEKKESWDKAVKKETETFVKRAAKAGLGGLTLEECVVGAMFGKKFRFMPDPLSEKERAEWLGVEEMIQFSESDTTDDKESDEEKETEGGEEVSEDEPARKKRRKAKSELGEVSATSKEQLKMRAVTALRKVATGLQLQSDGLQGLANVVKDTPAAQVASLLHMVGLSMAQNVKQEEEVKEEVKEEGASASDTAQPSTSAESDAEPRPIWLGKGNGYQCSVCGVKKGSKGGCLSHIVKAHSKDHYVCHLCEWSSSNIDSLRRHLREEH